MAATVKFKPCVAADTSFGYLLEIAKRWGLFAAIMIGLLCYIIWFQTQLYNESKENKQYIQHELVTELRESTILRAKLVNTLERTNVVLEKCSQALTDVHQSKQPLSTIGESYGRKQN